MDQLIHRTRKIPPYRVVGRGSGLVTGMAEIGIQPHVIEAVVNHIAGHKGDVADIYNRATYAAEKASALQRWADHVEAGPKFIPPDVASFRITTPPGPNI